VNAKSYDNEAYAKEVDANDSQWAEKKYDRKAYSASQYGKNAASSRDKDGYYGNSYGSDSSSAYGKQASRAKDYGSDAWGRDQKLNIKTSFDKTAAKKYGAESYDEWDNKDSTYYGKQAWNRVAKTALPDMASLTIPFLPRTTTTRATLAKSMLLTSNGLSIWMMNLRMKTTTMTPVQHQSPTAASPPTRLPPIRLPPTKPPPATLESTDLSFCELP